VISPFTKRDQFDIPARAKLTLALNAAAKLSDYRFSLSGGFVGCSVHSAYSYKKSNHPYWVYARVKYVQRRALTYSRQAHWSLTDKQSG